MSARARIEVVAGNAAGTWLDVTDEQLASAAKLKEFADEVKSGGFTDILLLGMGGSSLCPEVLALTFGQIPGFPRLHILDSTDPAQIRSVEKKIDLAKTLFIVSSKSGGVGFWSPGTRKTSFSETFDSSFCNARTEGSSAGKRGMSSV